MLARLFIAFFMLLVVSEAFSALPIAFSRCPATPEWTDGRNVTLSDDSVVYAEKTFKVDVLDRFNEVNFPLSRYWSDATTFITPCDLIYRDAAGVEEVIEDCSSTFNAGGGVSGTSTCSAMDPHVSYDGTTIYYTVYRGTVFYRKEKFNDQIYHPDAKDGIDVEGSEYGYGFKPIPNATISSDGAHIKKHVVGGATSTITAYAPGIWDISPFPLPGPDGRIGFVSTRSGTSLQYVTTNVIQHTTASEPVMSIWTMDASGKNLLPASSHARTQEQHPIVLKDGRVVYSSWQIGMGIPFSKTQGTPGGSFTILNSFKPWHQFPDGSRNFPLIGQHSPQAAVNSSGEDFNALHFFAQRPNEDFCTANYYRGGNNGSGAISCCPLPGNFGEEGQDPHKAGLIEADQYLPENCYNVADWAINTDDISTLMTGFPNTPVAHPNYTSALPHSGKLSWPFAIPSGDGALGVTWAKGTCSVVGNGDESFVAIGATPPQRSVDANGYDFAINHVTSLAEALQTYGNGYTSDIPGCNLGIYIASTIPVTNPDDLVMLVDTKGNHEFGARAVVPYTDIYGVSEPAVLDPIKSADLPKGSPFGYVGAASVTDREILPFGGVPDLTTVNIHAFNLQGTQTVEGITDDDICGVRFAQMHHNDTSNPLAQVHGTTGERVAIIGDLYTRNKDGNGDPIMETDGIHVDTSFLAEIPANIPYTMFLLDCEGRNLAVDQTWQHVKPGEKKVCGGCHVGHSPDHPPRNTFAASHAATPGYTPFQLGRGTVPLLTGIDGNGDPIYNNISGYGVVVNYDEHIKPILLSRCASCHSISGNSTSGREKGLVLDHNPVDPTDYLDEDIKSTYWRLVYDRFQEGLDDEDPPGTHPWQIYKHSYGGSTDLNRPYVSKYIVAFNSRRSLLYWKAKGERTDNNTDGEYLGDLDYGAAHPATGITDEELRWIARWIDTGAQAGPGATDDKMPPTIHMDITKNVSDEITHIIIGTVDLGSGIDPNSLNVCLMSGASCGANLAGSASMNGIVSITLGTPISDPNQVIRASVDDVAGNTRTVEFTAGYLMGLGDTSPPPDPDPVSISVGGNETITEGDTFSRTITFTDGEDAGSDGWTVDIDWCGTPENGVSVAAGQSSFGISRLFSTAGSCAVTVTITDDVGDTDNDTFTITIDAAGGGGDPDPLSINAGGRAFVYEGNTFQRVVTLTDGEDTNSDGWTYSVDWGGVETTNGTIPAGSSSFTISRFMADGNKTSRMDVAVTVVDVAGVDESTDTFTLITRDVPRKGTITGAATA
ncbi:hypothetical protein, partial [Nitrosomonas marina]